MLLKNRLFTPGPTPLLPAAQNAMAAFTAHHRTADFKALYTRVLSDMKDFIGTQNDVLVLASSGTGVMEGAVSNLTSPGTRFWYSRLASSANAGAIWLRHSAATGMY